MSRIGGRVGWGGEWVGEIGGEGDKEEGGGLGRDDRNRRK